jgi:hypothetical protein
VGIDGRSRRRHRMLSLCLLLERVVEAGEVRATVVADLDIDAGFGGIVIWSGRKRLGCDEQRHRQAYDCNRTPHRSV